MQTYKDIELLQNQSYTTDRQTTFATGRRLSQKQEPPLIPYALSCSISEIHQSDLGTSWPPDRNDPCISQCLGETLRDRRHQRLGDTTGPRPEVNNGLLGEETVRKAIENDRQSVKKAKEAWQQALGKEASESTFKEFLSALVLGYRCIRKRPKGKPSLCSMRTRPRSCKNSYNRRKTVSSIFIMEMKATSALRDMCHTDGNSAVRMSIFHPKGG